MNMKVVISSDECKNQETELEKKENKAVNNAGEEDLGNSASSDSSELFQVDKIVDCKLVRKKKFFKVRWQGYGSEEDTWEPEDNLRENLNLIGMLDSYAEKFAEPKERVAVIKRKLKEPKYVEESVSEDEDWFGIKPDEGSREARRLYVADRIPSATEKMLADIDPDVRVLRNHLRSSIDTNSQTRGETSLSKTSITRQRRTASAKKNLVSFSSSSLEEENIKEVQKKRKPVKHISSSSKKSNKLSQSNLMLNKLKQVIIQNKKVEGIKSPLKTEPKQSLLTTEHKQANLNSKEVKSIDMLKNDQNKDELFKDNFKMIVKSKLHSKSKSMFENKRVFDGNNYKHFNKAPKNLLMKDKIFLKDLPSSVNVSAFKPSKPSCFTKKKSFLTNPSEQGPSFSLADSKLPLQPLKNSFIIKKSCRSSAGTIIDSLIPPSTSTAFSGIGNSTTFAGGSEKNITAKRLRINSLEMPMIVSSPFTNLPNVITERMRKHEASSVCLSQEEFEDAVMDGKVDQVQDALNVAKEKLPDLDNVDSSGRSLLHKISELKCNQSHTYCELIDVLVTHGARMDFCDLKNGQTPLHCAISSRRLCHVRKLLALNSPVNMTDFSEQPPIITAFNCSDVEFINALLNAGATFQSPFRLKPTVNKHLIKRINHHQIRLQAAFDKARSAIFLNVNAKAISPIFVNTLHESRILEHTFRFENTMSTPNQAICVLTCLCDFKSAKLDAQMWGNYTPIVGMSVNECDCRLLSDMNKFIYLAAPRSGYNSLNIELDPALISFLVDKKISTFSALNAGDDTDINYFNIKLLTQLYCIQTSRCNVETSNQLKSSPSLKELL